MRNPSGRLPQATNYTAQMPKFKALNLFVILFSVVQMILYSIEAGSAGCQQVVGLAVGYIVSYALYCQVGVLGWLSITRPKLALATIFYAFANMLAKVVVIVILCTYGWKHVGQCYINTAVKVSVICCSVVELIILAVQMGVMVRIRQIHQLIPAMDSSALSTNSTQRPFVPGSPYAKQI